ncbi:MAG: toll/interleukin-1 receptor domain-containing protein [Nitrospirales bacterium]|nr:toll/interleukin-1 receptor domain-containing protein [Nitrospirales bacterium]
MASAFLSYSRADFEELQPLLKTLSTKGMVIWRDQEKIYGGEKWPKVLGEAIDNQDFFFLAWSKQSAQSDYVELEWCTALALKKTIIPLRLDDTPLPAALRSFETISTKNNVSSSTRILDATRQPTPPATSSHRKAVLEKLATITQEKPETVLEKAKVLFSQQGWLVRWNTYQAGRDLNIFNVNFPKISILITLVVVLSLYVLLAVFPGTSNWPYSIFNDAIEQELGGTILNEEAAPITGVEVSLPKYQKITKTDTRGYWHFKIEGLKEEKVDILAQKSPEYEPFRTSGTLGNTNMSFLMDRKHP